MKKIICFICTILLFFLLSIEALAVGEGNIDTGGGGIGSGTSDNVWSPGSDGVRVTIIRDSDNTPVSISVDFSNKNTSSVEIHFGTVSKVSYRDGKTLSPKQGGYHSVKPQQSMPTIVSSSSSNNIDAIRSYFTDEIAIRDIADAIGFNYDDLISGSYKILLEPMAYFKYEGIMFAMTAHEASLYDQAVSGKMRSKMGALSHKNLPLAMFLETPDLGFPAWEGSTTSSASNSDIQSALGLGIIRFSAPDPTPPQESQYTYRCETEVITSVTVSSSTQKTPDNPAYVTFNINGRNYTHSNIFIPEGDSQLAWVKWKTPQEPCNITITVSSNCNVSSHNIVVKIVDMNANEPPDPQANDRNDSFQIPSVPNMPNTTSLTWGEWDCWWHANWVWVGGEDGSWEDHGWWEYEWLSYSASLTASMRITPDGKAPTATSNQMKSGYGFNMDVSTELRSTAPSGHITGVQNVVAYFPEFNYQSFWRLLDRKTLGYSSSFEFKKNKYSTYNRRVHFTPVWYPDSQYVTYGELLDAWTPAGMLQINLTSGLTIDGNLFSDWHIGPKR